MTPAMWLTLALAIIGVLHGPAIPAIIKAIQNRGQRK